MKKAFYILLLTAFFSCDTKKEKKHFKVEGTIKNTTAKIIYLEENIPGGPLTIIDSTSITNGSFQLKAVATEETRYQLRLAEQPSPFISLINDVPELKLKIDFSDTAQPFTIEGSPASQVILQFDKAIFAQSATILNQGNLVDSLKSAAAGDSIINTEYVKLITITDDLKNYAVDFINKSNSPLVILYAVSSYQNSLNKISLAGFSNTELTQILNDAATRFPNHKGLQSVKNNFAADKAPEFTQPDSAGKSISLSSFKGKYVLLDFWASWCKPCRLENPNVVKAYNQFKDKNFTVFGISLDQNKESWLQAIQQDGLTWTQASDLKFWGNEAAILYGIQSIPANFLIDPQGNIVAKNLQGAELIMALTELMK